MYAHMNGWNPWSTSAADLLDPLRNVLSSVGMRSAADSARRARLEHTMPRCSDAEILEQVERRISEDPRLRDSAIRVDGVYDGVVLLGGSAANAAAHTRAFEDAASVPGVRRVATEITTDDEAQDAA
jgi:osmotically-inducible protein OsmY